MNQLWRALRAMASQKVALGNAATAAAALEQRRLEQDDAVAYVLTRPWRSESAVGPAHDVASRATP